MFIGPGKCFCHKKSLFQGKKFIIFLKATMGVKENELKLQFLLLEGVTCLFDEKWR